MNKIIYFAACLVIASCNNPQQQLKKQIADEENVLFADSNKTLAAPRAGELLKLYVSYADQFKDDSMSAEFLFKAGDLANNLHKPVEAIELLGRVQEYKTYSKVPLALFLQGFIAETELNDLEHAKQYYETFLHKYPHHQLSNDVQASLNNLGKSPEELIREFEANKREQDSIVTR